MATETQDPASVPTPETLTETALLALDATEQLTALAETLWWKRLAVLVRNLAYVHGEDV